MKDKKVLICNNCKDIWIAPKEKCKCGCTTLTETHESNYKYAQNYNSVMLWYDQLPTQILESHLDRLKQVEANTLVSIRQATGKLPDIYIYKLQELVDHFNQQILLFEDALNNL